MEDMAPKHEIEINVEESKSEKSMQDENSQIPSRDDMTKTKKSYLYNVEVINEMIGDVKNRIENMEYIMNVDLENQSDELNRKMMMKARGKVKRSK